MKVLFILLLLVVANVYANSLPTYDLSDTFISFRVVDLEKLSRFQEMATKIIARGIDFKRGCSGTQIDQKIITAGHCFCGWGEIGEDGEYYVQISFSDRYSYLKQNRLELSTTKTLREKEETFLKRTEKPLEDLDEYKKAMEPAKEIAEYFFQMPTFTYRIDFSSSYDCDVKKSRHVLNEIAVAVPVEPSATASFFRQDGNVQLSCKIPENKDFVTVFEGGNDENDLPGVTAISGFLVTSSYMKDIDMSNTARMFNLKKLFWGGSVDGGVGMSFNPNVEDSFYQGRMTVGDSGAAAILTDCSEKMDKGGRPCLAKFWDSRLKALDAIESNEQRNFLQGLGYSNFIENDKDDESMQVFGVFVGEQQKTLLQSVTPFGRNSELIKKHFPDRLSFCE